MADDKGKQPIIIKKRKGGHAGAHGGAWKIAYADFVTAMMAFFLVMWIVGIAQESKHGIAEYFQNMSARATHQPASPYIVHMKGAPPTKIRPRPAVPRDNNFDKVQAELVAAKIDSWISAAPQLERLHPTVVSEIDYTEMRIQFADTAEASIFVGEGAELRPDGRSLIIGVAGILASNRSRMRIEGHSDGKPLTGNANGRWEVSSARAVAVRGALLAGNIGDDRVLEVKSLADTQLRFRSEPLNPGNRRVTIVIPFDVGDNSAPP